MKYITSEQFKDLINFLGVKTGDNIFLHSSLQYLGVPLGGIKMYYQVLKETIGDQGTIVVPTITNTYIKTRKFDSQLSPSESGVFSEFIRCLNESHRSLHPIQSIAAIGPNAKHVTGGITSSAFETDSCFERLIGLNFKLIFLGADLFEATIIHYSEQKYLVPYRHWMSFPGELITGNDKKTIDCRMYVRNREIDAKINFKKVEKWLVEKNLCKILEVNYGYASSCSLDDYVDIINKKIQENSWALVD